MGYVPPLCRLSKIMSFKSMAVVSFSLLCRKKKRLQKYIIKLNWCHDKYIGIEFKRCSSKNTDQDQYMRVCTLWISVLLWFIYRFYSLNARSEWNENLLNKHWTIFIFHTFLWTKPFYLHFDVLSHICLTKLLLTSLLVLFFYFFVHLRV